MRNLDLTPLFRSTIGFDRVHRALESALAADEAALSYPPYNIERLGDQDYRVTMAIAGFAPEDLDITLHDGVLIIRGKQQAEEGERQFLHRGIAGRAFERRFQLAEHIEVTGSSLENGLLHVQLQRRVPEALKPRRIEIGTQTLDQAA